MTYFSYDAVEKAAGGTSPTAWRTHMSRIRDTRSRGCIPRRLPKQYAICHWLARHPILSDVRPESISSVGDSASANTFAEILPPSRSACRERPSGSRRPLGTGSTGAETARIRGDDQQAADDDAAHRAFQIGIGQTCPRAGGRTGQPAHTSTAADGSQEISQEQRRMATARSKRFPCNADTSSAIATICTS